ncbi:MAG: hypothetical protein GWN71_34520, partial [Gammaproteobacteria bacterium]|nr:hypothetical protein [Gemmatimonadota bacterium]NIU78490.1 hypothetical protein [Gammaproteobacteria bacterium]
MIPIATLWLPILVTTVAVFVTSFLLWAVLPHHRSDYGQLPDEEAVREALRDAEPGLYNVPNLPSRAALEDPEYVAKL